MTEHAHTPEAPSTIPVSAVCVRRVGGDVQLLVEVDERWRLVAVETLAEHARREFSHVAEVNEMLGAPVVLLGSAAQVVR